jgi:hypothetical protein
VRPAAPPPSPDLNIDVVLKRLEKLHEDSKDKTPMEVLMGMAQILTDPTSHQPASVTGPVTPVVQTKLTVPAVQPAEKDQPKPTSVVVPPVDTKSPQEAKETWVIPVPLRKWENVYVWAACRNPSFDTNGVKVPRTIHFDFIDRPEIVSLGGDDFRLVLRIDATKKFNRWHGITFPCPIKDLTVFRMSKEKMEVVKDIVIGDKECHAFPSSPIDLKSTALEIHWSIDTDVYRLCPGPDTQRILQVTNSYSVDFLPH